MFQASESESVQDQFGSKKRLKPLMEEDSKNPEDSGKRPRFASTEGHEEEK